MKKISLQTPFFCLRIQALFALSWSMDSWVMPSYWILKFSFVANYAVTADRIPFGFLSFRNPRTDCLNILTWLIISLIIRIYSQNWHPPMDNGSTPSLDSTSKYEYKMQTLYDREYKGAIRQRRADSDEEEVRFRQMQTITVPLKWKGTFQRWPCEYKAHWLPCRVANQRIWNSISANIITFNLCFFSICWWCLKKGWKKEGNWHSTHMHA